MGFFNEVFTIPNSPQASTHGGYARFGWCSLHFTFWQWWLRTHLASVVHSAYCTSAVIFFFSSPKQSTAEERACNKRGLKRWRSKLSADGKWISPLNSLRKVIVKLHCTSPHAGAAVPVPLRRHPVCPPFLHRGDATSPSVQGFRASGSGPQTFYTSTFPFATTRVDPPPRWVFEKNAESWEKKNGVILLSPGTFSSEWDNQRRNITPISRGEEGQNGAGGT